MVADWFGTAFKNGNKNLGFGLNILLFDLMVISEKEEMNEGV